VVEADEDQITGLTGEEEGSERDHQQSVISLISTFGVLTVTILATLSATFAAISSYREDVANRSRQLWDSYSLALTVQQDEAANDAQALKTSQSIAAWRVEFERSIVGQSTSPDLQDALQAAMANAKTVENAKVQQSPSTQDRPPNGDCSAFSATGPGAAKADCAAQVATAYGETAESFLRNERAYLALASALAIALFLFALCRTLLLVPMQLMFVGVATAIALGSVGIGVYEYHWRAASQPDGKAIVDYEKSDYSSAVKLAPDFMDAWSAKGDYEAGNCSAAISDFAHAEQIEPNSINENNLASEETRCRQFSSAAQLLESALNDPKDAWAAGSAAELLLMEGALNGPKDAWNAGSAAEILLMDGFQQEKADAFTFLETAISYMRSISVQNDAGRGSYYQDLWFSSMLDDRKWISKQLDPADALRWFQTVEADEAKLDAQTVVPKVPTRNPGSDAITHLTDEPSGASCTPKPPSPTPEPSTSEPSTPEPLPTAPAPLGAALHELQPVQRAPKEIHLDTPLQVTFDYTGLQTGDVVTLLWYNASRFTSQSTLPNSTDAVAPTFEVVGQTGAPTPGSGTYTTPGSIYAPSGKYLLTAVVNSTFETQSCVKVPASSG
jgi:hypothetical protein